MFFKMCWNIWPSTLFILEIFHVCLRRMSILQMLVGEFYMCPLNEGTDCVQIFQDFTDFLYA